MAESLTISHKILLGSLYGLLALMVLFSIMANKNFGQEAYNKCVEKNVQEFGEQFLKRTRELGNCCYGAGGQLAQNSERLTCIFE